MRKILIVTPHYPPSNLAAVHRSRLFSLHLPSLGWQPIILTVHEKYYEEKPDWNLHALLPRHQKIEKVDAFKLTKPRLIGDIGLRGFIQLYKKAKQIIKAEQIDFLYIPIPSFYCALLGRFINKSTGIKYGIDYIDPWVHNFPGSEKIFSRHRISTWLAKILEPIAVKKASLITGVAEGYYNDVKKRNPHLINTCVFGAMPYGAEKTDFEKLASLQKQPYLFSSDSKKIRLVYAGAMLPKAYRVLEEVFKALSANDADTPIEFHFIGTGKKHNKKKAEYSIKPIAQQYNLWQKVVFEYPDRIPYLDVLAHLIAADGIFIFGSTEPHYTPSKVFQAILAKRPVMAILHQESTAVKMIHESKAGVVLAFDGEEGLNKIQNEFPGFIQQYLSWMKTYDPVKVYAEQFDHYSAASATRELVRLIESIS